jgi:hypothetical protein
MDKRYQVFVSSTYADLKEERKAVIQAVIEQSCIPAGMELFPATNEEQLSFIKRVIDDCDYYLLIVAGRYGSVGSDGTSYTEKEFDYAIERGLPIIALVHENPEEIAHGKSEKNPVLSERLEQFRNKVCTGRVVKHWKSMDQLPGFVAQSLSHAMHQFPAVGWVRANKVASEQLLNEVNELRKKGERLQQALESVKPNPTIDDLAGLDEEFVIPAKYRDRYSRTQQFANFKMTWREIFSIISPYLTEFPADQTVKSVLCDALFAKNSVSGDEKRLDDQVFKTVSVQLKALGLVKIEYQPTVAGGMGLFWQATLAGERLTVQLRTIRTALPKEGTNAMTTAKLVRGSAVGPK